MILIKKERDNKLYDSDKKQYIVLQDLLNYAKKGVIFKIINHENKDVTKQTLYSLLFYKNKELEYSAEDILNFIKNGVRTIN